VKNAFYEAAHSVILSVLTFLHSHSHSSCSHTLWSNVLPLK